MPCSNRKSVLIITLAAIFLIAASVFSQKQPTKKAAEDYENRQRALSLILLDSRIKSLDDAPMRCLARQAVVSFLVESGPADLYPYADDFVKACLDETVRNTDEFYSHMLGWHRNQMISLIRKIDRSKADLFESRYPIEGYAKSMVRSMELKESDDPSQVTAKGISEIRSGTIPSGLGSFLQELRRRDPVLANVVMEAAMLHLETHLNAETPDREVLFVSFNFLKEPAPPALRDRFLRLVLNMGRRAIADRTNDEFTKTAVHLLTACLPFFEQHLPAVLEEARSMLQVLQSTFSRMENQVREALERIERSDDKLAAAIAEAEAASEEPLRSVLWKHVSNLAFSKDELRIAVDATYEAKDKNLDGWRAFFVKEAVARRAAQMKDFDVIDYVLGKLEKPGDRAEVNVLVASVLAKDSKTEAVAYFTKGLELLKQAEATPEYLRVYLRAVELSGKMDEGDVFEIARDAVSLINRLPSASAEDIKESEGKGSYVQEILSPSANSVEQLFDVLAKRDPVLSYTISQGIQRRDLRLIAEIFVEKYKKYPLPPEGNEGERPTRDN